MMKRSCYRQNDEHARSSIGQVKMKDKKQMKKKEVRVVKNEQSADESNIL